MTPPFFLRDVSSNNLKKETQFKYVGQISKQVKYILPQNLSRKKLKKTKRKKKAQLSIWKCGLGILDIDTQLNSLERKWN